MKEKTKNIALIATIGFAAIGGIVYLVSRKKGSAEVGEAILSGNITDAETGYPLSGVLIAIGDESFLTENDGNFTLTLPAGGNYTITITAVGYTSRAESINLTVGNNTKDFSLSLSATDNGGEDGGDTSLATLTGHVSDWHTAELLKNVTIEIDGLTGTTNDKGEYTIAGITPGTHGITLSKGTNYHTLTMNITLTEGVNAWYFTMMGAASSIVGTGMAGDVITFGTPKYKVGDVLRPYSYTGTWDTYEITGFVANGKDSYYTYYVLLYGQFPYDIPEPQWKMEDPIWWR